MRVGLLVRVGRGLEFFLDGFSSVVGTAFGGTAAIAPIARRCLVDIPLTFFGVAIFLGVSLAVGSLDGFETGTEEVDLGFVGRFCESAT